MQVGEWWRFLYVMDRRIVIAQVIQELENGREWRVQFHKNTLEYPGGFGVVTMGHLASMLSKNHIKKLTLLETKLYDCATITK